jgi:hypothetical protein
VAILNNVDHGDLRCQMGFGAAFGDAVNRMQLFPAEFAEAQRHHPIVFAPDQDGRLSAMVLLGFDRGENLHLGADGWGESYIPVVRRRGPFSVSVKADASGAESEMLVEVDLADPRIGTMAGEPLFRPHGGNSAFLETVTEALLTLYEGAQAAPLFMEALVEQDLLREVQIEIDLGEGKSISIPGHFVIDENQFAKLGAAELKALRDGGYLVPIIHAMGSIANIQRLVDRKLRQLQLAA